MKTLFSLKTAIIYLIFLVLTTSCSNDDSPTISNTKAVTFSFFNGEVGSRIESENEPASVRLSIVDSDGMEVHSEIVLKLFAFGDSHVSESIELKLGTYQLTLFQILDEEDMVIMASPLVGSIKADEVDHPLPISFEVEEGETTSVIPEVLLVEDGDQPSDFGYANFGFILINDFALDVSIISDYDSAFVNSIVSIKSYDEDSVAISDWTYRYESGTEQIVGLDKSAHFYAIRVDASLHHSISYFLTTDYLRSLESLNLRLSPSDFTHKYQLKAPVDPFDNVLNLYLPKDGCVSHARLDATGMNFFYLFLSIGYYEHETGIPLLPSNGIEVFDIEHANLFYPNQSAAEKSESICDLIDAQYDDNPSFDVEIYVLMDDGEEFSFAAYAWDSTTGIWRELEE